ncbi:hypothetical protein [Paenibacillus sp. FSL R7-0337]|uniref:DUF7638 domain-containing protein n=1 Tax=Paenibacillus sp. FSL R7-0337 TaxID=1926588 RepID=UPI00096DCCBA|nr:hypothetical protein [Paenibacillus sp. FSL R7-0337]OMF96508.1 hypothetical protein BK147_14170 [Paenibacillus sp. FSL R7-0337]
MRAIRRTKTVEGTSIPGIIHNGGSYFYINVDVYEDGMVNCWELIDLKGLSGKIQSGWLTPAAPAGEQLSIHGLGAYTVESAKWTYNEASYYQHIQDTVARLNPELTNIYDISEREQERNEARRIAHSPSATEFYVNSEMFYQTTEGKSVHLFMKYGGKNYLADVVVYMDGRVVLYNLPAEAEYRLEELDGLFADGTLFTTLDVSTPVQLLQLGEVTLGASLYSSDAQEKLKELHNLHKQLNGEQTAHEACRAAYYAYLENPGEYYREQLRIKYELVPEHERMYLGDMDSKDWDYQRILYHPEETREV